MIILIYQAHVVAETQSDHCQLLSAVGDIAAVSA